MREPGEGPLPVVMDGAHFVKFFLHSGKVKTHPGMQALQVAPLGIIQLLGLGAGWSWQHTKVTWGARKPETLTWRSPCAPAWHHDLGECWVMARVDDLPVCCIWRRFQGDGRAELSYPAAFTVCTQRLAGSGAWMFPAADSQEWLCAHPV